MTKDEIFSFINENPIFCLATSAGNVPYVRCMMIYRADDGGIIFATGENKELCEQLSKNPRVELCFYDVTERVQVRVAGTVEAVEDYELKQEVGCNDPFLKQWVDKKGYEVVVVYCLKRGKATVWTMENNLKPKEYVQL